MDRWTEKDLDVALNVVGCAYQDLARVQLLEDVAFGLRTRVMQKREANFAA